jgi:rhodanese-related sulfurtransferase
MNARTHRAAGVVLLASALVGYTHAAATVTDAGVRCATVAVDAIDLEQHPPRLVDARPFVLPTDVQIPGAVPVRAFARVAEGDTAPLLLIGTGLGSKADQAACGELVKLGHHDIQVLRGGIRAWVRAGLPSWGNSSGQDGIDRLNPAQAYAAAVRGDIQLVIVRDVESIAECPEVTPALHCFDSVAALTKALRRADPEIAFAVAASDADWARIQRHAMTSKAPRDLIAVSGGSDALQLQFLRQQTTTSATGQTLWMSSCQMR